MPMMALAARCELRGGARQHSRFNNCGEGGLALTCLIMVVARARGWGPMPMMALAARCELRGGARQHSRFNNCGEGGLALTCLIMVSRARGGGGRCR